MQQCEQCRTQFALLPTLCFNSDIGSWSCQVPAPTATGTAGPRKVFVSDARGPTDKTHLLSATYNAHPLNNPPSVQKGHRSVLQMSHVATVYKSAEQCLIAQRDITSQFLSFIFAQRTHHKVFHSGVRNFRIFYKKLPDDKDWLCSLGVNGNRIVSMAAD